MNCGKHSTVVGGPEQARDFITLAYALRLYPTVNKSSVLPLYVKEFQRLHKQACEELLSRAWEQGHAGFPLGGLCQKGRGEFAQRALRRAWQDLRGQVKACKETARRFKIPYLKAEMLSAAETQAPRQAKHFDYWIHLEGLPKDQIYLPANGHKALNRALNYPGAILAKSAEIYRRNGKWYARVFVQVPVLKAAHAIAYLGCDVGVRKAVCTSDGYKGPDLRPILAKMKQSQADRQRRGIEKRTISTYQRSKLSHEARRIVLVAQQTGRAISLEDPARLIRWKGHAARFFGNRVVLLGQLRGVAVVLVPPPYTSKTCARCLTRETTVRLGEDFWCADCRILTDADVNAARVISRMAHAVSGHGAQKTLGARLGTSKRIPARRNYGEVHLSNSDEVVLINDKSVTA